MYSMMRYNLYNKMHKNNAHYICMDNGISVSPAVSKEGRFYIEVVDLYNKFFKAGIKNYVEKSLTGVDEINVAVKKTLEYFADLICGNIVITPKVKKVKEIENNNYRNI